MIFDSVIKAMDKEFDKIKGIHASEEECEEFKRYFERMIEPWISSNEAKKEKTDNKDHFDKSFLLEEIFTNSKEGQILNFYKSHLSMMLSLSLFIRYCKKQKNPKRAFVDILKEWKKEIEITHIKSMKDQVKYNPPMSKITGMDKYEKISQEILDSFLARLEDTAENLFE